MAAAARRKTRSGIEVFTQRIRGRALLLDYLAVGQSN
jgi:hypothetical protein